MEIYNFIYDFLSAFTSFNFTPELQQALNESRRRVATEKEPQEKKKSGISLVE